MSAVAVKDSIDIEEIRKHAITPIYPGECCLCRKRYRPDGPPIVRYRFPRHYAHLDCIEAGLEEETPPTTEELLEDARHTLREIVRATRSGNSADPEQLVADVHELAVQARLRVARRDHG